MSTVEESRPNPGGNPYNGQYEKGTFSVKNCI